MEDNPPMQYDKVDPEEVLIKLKEILTFLQQKKPEEIRWRKTIYVAFVLKPKY